MRGCLIERIGGAPVRKITLLISVLCGCALAVSANAARTESLSFKPQTVFQKRADKAVSEPSSSEFVFKDKNGKTVSAPIVEQYQKNRIVHPMAKIDPRLDPKLSRAATIADENEHLVPAWERIRKAALRADDLAIRAGKIGRDQGTA